ncbi:MAG: LytTR family DNA-binding domain-containing protein [Lachnospiraceae bacterium]|jgi:DNA-binding LytR/AlgR family response regulator|nr:LytTR family DNA-binding domain-containing protein [Lachnospiraceae bacterium]
MMKIVLIEDNSVDREIILSHLGSYFEQDGFSVEWVTEEFEKGEDFIAHFTAGVYDLIFLDYYMGTLSGMEVAQMIRAIDRQVTIIFTTYARDFAVDGYKVKAAGYLIKPIAYPEFSAIMDLVELRRLGSGRYLTLENGQESTKIFLEEIIYCDIYKHYTQVHTIGEGIKRFRMSFMNIAEKLSGYREFYLCYRGCIVNLAQVERVEELTLLMSSGERIPFRKREHHSIKNRHQEFLFERSRSSMY